MTLPLWTARAHEDAHLFNPAFCGALSFEFCKAFTKTSGKSSAAIPLLFCALPISLHMDTRRSLPNRTVTSLYTWLERNPAVLVGYANRATNLSPYLKQAISFTVARNALAITEFGELTVGSKKASFTPLFYEESTHEVKAIVDATRFLGRWFAGAGATSTILSAWGVSV